MREKMRDEEGGEPFYGMDPILPNMLICRGT